ncbi:MAG: hypothetical protein H7305_00280, partial [Gemmatimonadaceae bacterium]|nr:hypothetical protein [Gemmatimonadaceae bacterium]
MKIRLHAVENPTLSPRVHGVGQMQLGDICRRDGRVPFKVHGRASDVDRMPRALTSDRTMSSRAAAGVEVPKHVRTISASSPGVWSRVHTLMLVTCMLSAVLLSPAAAHATAPDETEFTQIAAGGSHTVALKNDGPDWAWGADASGQLGDGVIGPDSATPTQISPAVLSDVRSITAGASHTVALKNDGTVWAWGADAPGQLGDGVIGPTSATPTQISPAVLTNVR